MAERHSRHEVIGTGYSSRRSVSSWGISIKAFEKSENTRTIVHSLMSVASDTHIFRTGIKIIE